MLNAAWLIVHLMAGDTSMPDPAARPTGVSCTYQACMAKCGGLNRDVCHSYCNAKIPQRIATGICTPSMPYGG